LPLTPPDTRLFYAAIYATYASAIDIATFAEFTLMMLMTPYFH